MWMGLHRGVLRRRDPCGPRSVRPHAWMRAARFGYTEPMATGRGGTSNRSRKRVVSFAPLGHGFSGGLFLRSDPPPTIAAIPPPHHHPKSPLLPDDLPATSSHTTIGPNRLLPTFILLHYVSSSELALVARAGAHNTIELYEAQQVTRASGMLTGCITIGHRTVKRKGLPYPVSPSTASPRGGAASPDIPSAFG
jgi:hypothetical protein